MTQPLFQRMAVIGMGLIGGSLALAAKQAGLVGNVVGCARRQASIDKALELGVADSVTLSAAEAVKDADLVFLSVPVAAMGAVMADIAPHLAQGAIVTDGGSVKRSVLEAANRYLPVPANFVPGHPIAGREKSGVAAATADLYQQHRVILTPSDDTDKTAADKVRQLWSGVGADVLMMEVAEHDRVLAETSHLPHLLAFSLVDTLSRQGDSNDIFRYAAGGFRDFTRIASSSPEMWHDIFRYNDKSILDALVLFEQGLANFRRALEAGDSAELYRIMETANASRQFLLAPDQAPAVSQSTPSQSTHGPEADASQWPANMTNKMTNQKTGHFIRTRPNSSLTGSVRVPGDKSISHRSIMLGALAEGTTEITGFLEGQDALATLEAFRSMGVKIDGPHQGKVLVHGVGLNGLTAPANPIDLGNSGTSMRLLMGLLAGQDFTVELTGDASLNKRPMERVAGPLRQMGANVTTTEGGKPPVTLSPVAALKAMRYELPMASAQVKSAVLLAGLYAEGKTQVIEPAPTRDHTERMLRGFGYDVNSNGREITLKGGGHLQGGKLEVPADISSAAFYMVAACIAKDSDLCIEHVGVNPTRTGIIDILRLMGADICLENEREVGGEPVADVRVKYAPLKGIVIPENLVPLAIDEFPVLFVAAASAEGDTILHGAEELRVKESDRIEVMAQGLKQLGVTVETYPDGMKVTGGSYGGGYIEAEGDHRIAMSFAVAGINASAEITISGCETVATSFPGFCTLANGCGFYLNEEVVTA